VNESARTNASIIVEGIDECTGFFLEVLMLRLVGTATVFLVLVLGAPAGDQPGPKAKELAADTEKLNGTWISPIRAPGVTGNNTLKLDFKKDSTLGTATLQYFQDGVYDRLGPCAAELKLKDKTRLIVLSRTQEGKRVEVGEIAYEVNGDKLKLTCPKGLWAEMVRKAVQVSEEWRRRKADK